MEKILFAIDYLSSGGAERVTVWLANHFIKEFDVSILVDHHKDNEYRINEQVQVYYVDDHIKQNSSRLLKIYDKYKYIMSFFAQGNYKCCISLAMPQFNSYITAASIKNSTKLIISERNDPERYPSEHILRIIRDWTYNKSDVVVFQTKGARDYFPKKIREKAVVIWNPVSDELPSPYDGVRSKRVVTFCRLTPQKNLKLLVDAFELFYKEHQDFKLEIYGDGPLKGELIKYIKTKKCRSSVNIYPFKKDIYTVVLDACMFVLSSDYEGISNSMLEALCMGIPTICTDSPPGGAREFIKDGINGFLVPVGDKNRLADAMKRLADSTNLQKKFSIRESSIRRKISDKEIYYKWRKCIINEKN